MSTNKKQTEESLESRTRRMAKDYPFNGCVNGRAIEFVALLDARDRTISRLQSELDAWRVDGMNALSMAKDFDPALFLATDTGVADVMRRVLGELEKAKVTP